MKVIQDKDELREQLEDWRHAGDHVAIVPTMGNLHSGHISLVNVAREHAERVVVTVFVNPTQFGEGEDFDSYPRTFEKDTRKLRKVTADILFAPDTDTVYPFGQHNATRVVVPGLTEHLCGSFRPGHFDGVTTVVARLFALVQPDIAVFGQKDYQQQLVIRRMAEDLNLPVEVVMAPTVREEDGLAMSSRNAYLTDDERQRAPALHRSLSSIEADIRDGARNFDELEARAAGELEKAGFSPEYVAIRRADDLSPPQQGCHEYVVLAAARLGDARLIDNLLVSI
jgi:pantoate--beta-alanine ligase